MSTLTLSQLGSPSSKGPTPPSVRLDDYWSGRSRNAFSGSRGTFRFSELDNEEIDLIKRTNDVKSDLDFLMEKSTYYTRNTGLSIQEFASTGGPINETISTRRPQTIKRPQQRKPNINPESSIDLGSDLPSVSFG